MTLSASHGAAIAELAKMLVVVIGGVAVVAACRSVSAPGTPVETCVRACTTRAELECSESECSRGCEFILDRLIEREGDHVVDCVARAHRRCDDIVWADCAAKIGPHADGGPPAPLPPPED